MSPSRCWAGQRVVVTGGTGFLGRHRHKRLHDAIVGTVAAGVLLFCGNRLRMAWLGAVVLVVLLAVLSGGSLVGLAVGLGIVADDLAAGLYARLVMQIWILFAAGGGQ